MEVLVLISKLCTVLELKRKTEQHIYKLINHTKILRKIILMHQTIHLWLSIYVPSYKDTFILLIMHNITRTQVH